MGVAVMEHESNQKEFNIEDTDICFESIYKKPYFPTEMFDEIKLANILFIPEEDRYEQGDVLFPEITSELFSYMRENASNAAKIDIAISDDNFEQLELHSALIELGTFLCDPLVFNVLCSMIASFLYNKIKKLHRDSDNTSARINIITKERNNNKNIKISYKGPVSGINDAMKQAAKIVSINNGSDD